MNYEVSKTVIMVKPRDLACHVSNYYCLDMKIKIIVDIYP